MTGVHSTRRQDSTNADRAGQWRIRRWDMSERCVQVLSAACRRCINGLDRSENRLVSTLMVLKPNRHATPVRDGTFTLKGTCGPVRGQTRGWCSCTASVHTAHSTENPGAASDSRTRQGRVLCQRLLLRAAFLSINYPRSMNIRVNSPTRSGRVSPAAHTACHRASRQRRRTRHPGLASRR